ncbi:receptor-type tyrosine-protein phosphatase N2 isoform X2 [Cynoglossus semilaevis]|uniref:receptor-type tyrosine-protein phosphatase N2 isoform X2 n=1 Tax=Cynoglossus semilaevis TaxID=244447 RepID=UPI0007DC8A81|nr:receptor-type tyrosine-protein phosphatase N2 isoform X2 [Cynoglossus semilaevis]
MDPPCCPTTIHRQHLLLHLLLAALALSFYSSPALADGKFGCLFEDELCAQYEFCINDGVFGRCLELVGAHLYTYDIPPSALERLRILLQKLAHKGLTWQDDVTQQVISRELSRLKKTSSPSLAERLSALSSSSSSSSSRDREVKPAQIELSRNLQQYLTGLDFLPQAGADGQPEGNRAQSEDVWSSWSKPKHGWKETTVYSLHRGDGSPPLTKVFTQGGEGPHPKLTSSYSSQDPVRGKLRSNHLERLLGGAPGIHQESAGDQASWPREQLQYLGYFGPGLSEQTKLPSQETLSSKTQRPNLHQLLLEAGRHPVAAKEPLSVVDERLIQKVAKQLDGHSINLETLMTNDLDQLAEVITGALQEVDQERPLAGAQPDSMATMKGVNREMLSAMTLGQNLNQNQGSSQKDSIQMEQKGKQTDGGDKEPLDKNAAFFSKLLDYLNMDSLHNDGVGPPTPPQAQVGLESIQSHTSQGQAPVHQGLEEEEVKEGTRLRLTGGVEQPHTVVDSEVDGWMQQIHDQKGQQQQQEEPEKKNVKVKTQLVHIGVKEFSSRGQDRHFGYIITGSDVLGPALTFRVGPNANNLTTADLVRVAVQEKQQLEKESGVKIVEAGVSDRGSLTQIPVVKETRVESGQFLLLSVLCMLSVLVALAVSVTFFCVRQRSHLHMKEKLSSLGTDTSTEATATYQELCRQRMAIRTSERVERPETLRHSRLNSVSSQFSDGPAASPSTRSSTSSWCEEPVPSNMDISTGHMILSYMEDHLKNKNRLEREWEALCSYQAEPSICSVGQGQQNSKRNRSDTVVAYDHSRITLKAENNHGNSDYINASPIMDHDPRNPTYVASQGPLPSTVPDFWQMVWESGCVVIVMLTPLSENGVKQCHHYWPDEGADVYHIYEVNLVSEHIWCEDFLVRSFYLKNLQTNETRTVTQFHFLSWMDRGIPTSARTLLDFRRKVNKCYRGRSCPIIVHCSDGAGRSGTYILIDMVLNRMAKGAKEIDIAATLEHLRDQRAGMVQTKEQFEFALTAVAEEVNAILKALPQ